MWRMGFWRRIAEVCHRLPNFRLDAVASIVPINTTVQSGKVGDDEITTGTLEALVATRRTGGHDEKKLSE
jgi:hypothetical protein